MLDKFWRDLSEHFVKSFPVLIACSLFMGYSMLLFHQPVEFFQISFLDRVIHSLSLGLLPVLGFYGVFSILYESMIKMVKSYNKMVGFIAGYLGSPVMGKDLQELKFSDYEQEGDFAAFLVFVIVIIVSFSATISYYWNMQIS